MFVSLDRKVQVKKKHFSYLLCGSPTEVRVLGSPELHYLLWLWLQFIRAIFSGGGFSNLTDLCAAVGFTSTCASPTELQCCKLHSLESRTKAWAVLKAHGGDDHLGSLLHPSEYRESGSGRSKLGGQVKQNEAKGQKLNFRWNTKASAFLPASSLAWLLAMDNSGFQSTTGVLPFSVPSNH